MIHIDQKTMISLVQENPLHIGDIENPPEEVQLAAVKVGPWCLKFIENPSEEVQLAAMNVPYSNVRSHPIEYVKNPSRKVIEAALAADTQCIHCIENIPDDIQETLVKSDPFLSFTIRNPSEKTKEAKLNIELMIESIGESEFYDEIESLFANGYSPSQAIEMTRKKYNL